MWLANQRHGLGRMEYTNGDAYEGTWERDVRQGPATYFYANRDIFVGRYVRDRREGLGTIYMVRLRGLAQNESGCNLDLLPVLYDLVSPGSLGGPPALRSVCLRLLLPSYLHCTQSAPQHRREKSLNLQDLYVILGQAGLLLMASVGRTAGLGGCGSQA